MFLEQNPDEWDGSKVGRSGTERDEVEEVSRSQIVGLRASWAFRGSGGGLCCGIVTHIGKQGVPSMQRHSIGPFYKPLTSGFQMSPECVCGVVGAYLGVFSMASVICFYGNMCSILSPKLTKGSWSTEHASWMLAWLPLSSPCPPEPNYQLPNLSFSYPTHSRLLPLVLPIPGSLIP